MKKSAIRTYSRNGKLIAQRRDHIAQCVAPLFVKKGYERTSIREIAESCGMSMGALYYYVGGKEDILQIMLDYDLTLYISLIKEMVENSRSLRAREALIKVLEQYYRASDASQDLTLFFYQETKSLHSKAREVIEERERSLVAEFEKLLNRGCKAGEFKIENITLVANQIVVTGHMWALRRWLLKHVCSLDEYIKNQIEFFLNAIIAE
ncbi:MAG: TetR/AcrR family transcriptional regulator [Dehalococcoidia bacterium]|nr:TetR/AcrR family transcriptional regulator [Dehalococcoidia bacterium]